MSQHLYPAERDEIRRALGGLLLDENAGLFAEASALADILGDVQLDNAALLARQALCSNPQRSMVEGEIRMLIDRLHCAAASTPFGSSAVRERDPDSLLPRSGRRDRALLDYVTTVAQLAETGGRPPSAALPPRPPTALSASAAYRPGTSASTSAASVPLSRPTTALSAPAGGGAASTFAGGAGASRPSSAASSSAASSTTRYTDAPSVVAGVAEQLSLASINAVRDTLKAALADERAALLEDIEYLQGLLDMEADLQVKASAPPPSLAELKDYSSRLAEVVASEEGRVEHEVRVSAMFAAAEEQGSRPGRLRGMVDASRRPPSASSLAPTAAAATAAAGPAVQGARRPGSGGDAGGVGGSAQTLVVHAAGEEGSEQRRTPSHAAASPSKAGAAHSPSAASAAVRATAAPASASAEAGSSISGLARGSALAAVRRPGSGGSGGLLQADAPSSSAFLLQPLAGALRPPHPLPAVRPPSGPADGAAASESSQQRADSNGTEQPPQPGRIRPSSPGRLLQPGLGLLPVSGTQAPLRAVGSASAHPHSTPPTSTHARREPSPARPAGSPGILGSTGAGTGPSGPHRTGSTSAGAPSVRPMPPRSSSTGPSTPERGSGASNNGSATVSAAPAASHSSPGIAAASKCMPSRPSSTVLDRHSSGSRPGASATSKASVSSPGTAVAARLGAVASSSSGAAAAPAAPAVQYHALLGGKHSVVEVLEAEVDAVRGGVAAILQRYNIRPSTPSSGPSAAAGAAPAAPTAPPPSAAHRAA